MYERIVRDCTMLVTALGYDMNTVEWAIKDGVPYAIDFMNPAPDMDINSLGQEFYRWCVEHMADMCIRLAKQPQPQSMEMRWNRFFGGEPFVAQTPPPLTIPVEEKPKRTRKSRVSPVGTPRASTPRTTTSRRRTKQTEEMPVEPPRTEDESANEDNTTLNA
jgi:hypothetical protein